MEPSFHSGRTRTKAFLLSCSSIPTFESSIRVLSKALKIFGNPEPRRWRNIIQMNSLSPKRNRDKKEPQNRESCFWISEKKQLFFFAKSRSIFCSSFLFSRLRNCLMGHETLEQEKGVQNSSLQKFIFSLVRHFVFPANFWWRCLIKICRLELVRNSIMFCPTCLCP